MNYAHSSSQSWNFALLTLRAPCPRAQGSQYNTHPENPGPNPLSVNPRLYISRHSIFSGAEIDVFDSSAQDHQDATHRVTFEKFVEIFSNYLEMEFGVASNAVLLLHESKLSAWRASHTIQIMVIMRQFLLLFLSKIEIVHRWDCRCR